MKKIFVNNIKWTSNGNNHPSEIIMEVKDTNHATISKILEMSYGKVLAFSFNPLDARFIRKLVEEGKLYFDFSHSDDYDEELEGNGLRVVTDFYDCRKNPYFEDLHSNRAMVFVAEAEDVDPSCFSTKSISIIDYKSFTVKDNVDVNRNVRFVIDLPNGEAVN